MPGSQERGHSPERDATTHRIYCPVCRYGIFGLPEYHACPECGMGFDPHMVIIHARPGLRELRYFAVSLLTLLIAGPCLFRSFLLTFRSPVLTQAQWQDMSIIVAVVFVAACFAVPLYFWRRWKIIIQWKGVSICRGRRCVKTIYWSDFDTVKVVGPRLQFIDAAGRVSAQLSPADTGNRRTRLQCATEINRLAGIYRNIRPSPHRASDATTGSS